MTRLLPHVNRKQLALAAAGVLCAALSAPAPGTAAQKKGAPGTTARTPAPSRAADRIRARDLRAYLEFLAADELEGRDTPSRGLDTAALFLATQLKLWGLKPAGDEGSYFQQIQLRRSRLDPARCTAALGSQVLRYGADFAATTPGFPPTPRPGTAEGPLVYVGPGWMARAKKMDPYAGQDVKGKILLIQSGGSGLPRGLAAADLNGEKGVDWDDPQGSALRLGAAGIVWLPRLATLANWEQNAALATRISTVVEKFSPAGEAVPQITASAALMQSLFRGEKLSADEVFAQGAAGGAAESFALTPSKVLKFTVALSVEKLLTRNVVAVLEGSDPKLRGEYVALGAHYDHVGMREGMEGDRIFNGADDDGSGTAALLAMAETWARGVRPKRSLLFIWHAGEEKGLWGSRYFVENPTVPLDKIIAQLNIDMIGRSKPAGDTNPRNANLSGPDQIYVIGSRMMSDELAAVSEQVNSSYLKLEFDYRYDDPKDPNRFFFRSDHINYARKGIPIIFYFDGVHEDYHRVTDHADRIDYRKLERVTRTICATATALGDAPQRPKVVRTLPPELQARPRPGR